MAALPNDGKSSVDSTTSRNATKINLRFLMPGGNSWERVGRVQSLSEDITNNVQALMELGSQYVVELKKGITSFTFSIAKMYVRGDKFDDLVNGAIFGLEIADEGIQLSDGTLSPEIIEQFSYCAVTSISRSFQQGQATVA